MPDLDKNTKSIRPENAALTNLPHLTWKDDFFDDDEDIIAVFDFDYNVMEEYYAKLGFVKLTFIYCWAPIRIILNRRIYPIIQS